MSHLRSLTEQKTLIIFPVSVDRESRSSLAGWFWLEVFHKVIANLVASQQEGLMELEDLFLR